MALTQRRHRGLRWVTDPSSVSTSFSRARPAALGKHVTATYGRLPFLLKLLAAAEPLSLQAHPTPERALAGFARENAAGLAVDDPARSYRDESHKPELICALTRFRALSGFLEPTKAGARLRSLDVEALESVVKRLEAADDPSVLVDTVESILSLAPNDATAVADAVALAVRGDGPYEAEWAVARRIAETHPGDAGIVIALLLELVTLEPGQAIYLGAGRLHTYIDGLGVEIMASSDNVLRGGLTAKHVDVAELVATLAPNVEPIEIIEGTPIGDSEFEYRTRAVEFLLSRIEVSGVDVHRVATGPEVVLVTAGNLVIDGQACPPIDARFIPAGVAWTISGHGQAFRARVSSST